MVEVGASAWALEAGSLRTRRRRRNTEECALKASFLDAGGAEPRSDRDFALERRLPLLEVHLGRLARSASSLGYLCREVCLRPRAP